jgi:hypothetical protein
MCDGHCRLALPIGITPDRIVWSGLGKSNGNLRELGRRGVRIAVCDAGFGNHQAMLDLLGSTVRIGVPLEAHVGSDTIEERHEYLLQGSGSRISREPPRNGRLPLLRPGDTLAVRISGGSFWQPGLAEYALHAGQLTDISRSP